MISLALVLCALFLHVHAGCFEKQYVADESFAASGVRFANVTDVAVDVERRLVFVLQRSRPPVTVWSTNGTLRFAWATELLGYPHSITLNVTHLTVWITDMAGPLAAGNSYGHCIKHFTYGGKYVRSIGECGKNTNGSSLDPPQFDKVTDIAFNSKGYCYITDGDVGGLNNRVLVFDPNFKLVDVWNKENKPGSGSLQFNLPHSVIIDACDRVWVVDTLNHRLQIISANGTLLSMWTCFEKALIYGIDIDYIDKFIILTTVSSDERPEILFVPFNNECGQNDFGACTIQKRLVLKENRMDSQHNSGIKSSTLLHSLAFDTLTGSLYVSELPGSIPPRKFYTVPPPPSNNASRCSGDGPPSWQAKWSATVLLTPFHDGDLKTATIEYSAPLKTMYVALQGWDGRTEVYLNTANETYVLHTNSTSASCAGPYDFGWVAPPQSWLDPQKCQCKGSLNVSGTQTRIWRCVMYKYADWFWFREGSNDTYRIFLNNQSNPYRLPVLGNFTLVHFASYGTDISNLLKAHATCTSNKANAPKRNTKDKLIFEDAPAVKGFSYDKCSTLKVLPSWPEHFYLTVTMIPVLQNYDNPFPTSVVYDWQVESQRTTMCEPDATYDAYLIHNNTYITQQSLKNGTVSCISHFNFGPPVPNWMDKDKCKCMGTITSNAAISPWNLTYIVVCPLEKSRVFWAWFTTDAGYRPLLFMETQSPPNEGTGLALADYHDFYSNEILIDMHAFEVPSKCNGT